MINRFEHGGNIYKINREHGISENKIVDFSANINPLGMSEFGKKAYIDALDMINNYPDPEYIKLKKSIADYHKVSLNNLFIGNGAIEMIYKTFTYISPENAIIVAPTFVEYERALIKASVKPDFYILEEEDNFEVDIEKLKELSSKYKLIVMCSPNNPTGKVIDKAHIIDLLNYIDEKSFDCKLFLDEAFIDFVSEDESMINLVDTFSNLFILRSATKFFAIPGLRIGYVISSDNGLRNFYEDSHIPWSINTVAQEVLVASLLDQEYIKNTLTTNSKSRDALYEKLKGINALKVYNSRSSYILLKVLKNIDLRSELLKEGFLIRSCSNYIGLDETYYRIAVKTHDENMFLAKLISDLLNYEVLKND